MLVESQYHHQFVFSDSMRYFRRRNLLPFAPLTHYNALNFKIFCLQTDEHRREKTTTKRTCKLTSTCQSIAFDSSMDPDRLTQSAPAQVHSCTAFNLCFYRQSYFELPFAILLPLVLNICPMPQTPSLRTDEENFSFKY